MELHKSQTKAGAGRRRISPQARRRLLDSVRLGKPTVQSKVLVANIQRDVNALIALDKSEFVRLAGDIQEKREQIENTTIGEAHPHLKWLQPQRDNIFLEDMIQLQHACLGQ